MKQIITLLIKAYKKTLSPLLDLIFGKGNTCRYELTCSDYAIKAISKHGVIKGGALTIMRIAHCHPLASNTLKYESI